MKYKVKALVNKKSRVDVLRSKLDTLKTCPHDTSESVLHIHSEDADEIEATLSEYGELLDALLDFAEINI